LTNPTSLSPGREPRRRRRSELQRREHRWCEGEGGCPSGGRLDGNVSTLDAGNRGRPSCVHLLSPVPESGFQESQQLDPDLFLPRARDARALAKRRSGNPRGRPPGIPNPRCRTRPARRTAGLARITGDQCASLPRRKEIVREIDDCWIGVVRPSRRPRSLSSGRAQRGPGGGLLGMRDSLNAVQGFPHAEERLQGASRSTHHLAAAVVPPPR